MQIKNLKKTLCFRRSGKGFNEKDCQREGEQKRAGEGKRKLTSGGQWGRGN